MKRTSAPAKLTIQKPQQHTLSVRISHTPRLRLEHSKQRRLQLELDISTLEVMSKPTAKFRFSLFGIRPTQPRARMRRMCVPTPGPSFEFLLSARWTKERPGCRDRRLGMAGGTEGATSGATECVRRTRGTQITSSGG